MAVQYHPQIQTDTGLKARLHNRSCDCRVIHKCLQLTRFRGCTDVCVCTRLFVTGRLSAKQRLHRQCALSAACLIVQDPKPRLQCLQVLLPHMMNPVQKDQHTQRIISGLHWIAARAGPATTELSLEIWTCKAVSASRCSNPFVQAFSKSGPLDNLKRMHTHLFSPAGAGAAVEIFLKWLLERIPGLETLTVQQEADFSFAAIQLAHLKHLELYAFRMVDVRDLIATQLPVLETLCMDGYPNYTIVRGVDVSECRHLRRLAFKDTLVQRLIRQLSSRLSCRLNILGRDHMAVWNPDMQAILKTAEDIRLRCGDFFPCQAVQGIFAHLPSMRSLTMSGQGLRDAYLLGKCMPACGLHMCLRVLAMHADKMRCYIPAGLPNLEELYVMAKQDLVLGFAAQDIIFSSLKKFYAFGDPLTCCEYGLLIMTVPVLAKRGLYLESVEALVSSKNFRAGSKCLYLRPTQAEQLSIGALHKRVSQLAWQCRCGACYTCLRAAGYL